MIKKLGDFNNYIAIAGFRDTKILNVDEFLKHVRTKTKKAHIQFFDAKVTASWEHLFFAGLNALNAFKNKQNISNSPAVEALLFASTQRQISKAVKMIGIKHGSSQVAVLVIAETQKKATAALETITQLIPGERDDCVLGLTEEKTQEICKLFNISNLEFKAKLMKEGLEKKALVDLVIEREALLTTQR